MLRRSKGNSTPAIRTLAVATIAAIAIVAVLVAAALVRTAAMLETATASIVRNAQSWALASEAELALLMYQRISNLYAVTREPELEATRHELEGEMMRLLAAAESYVSSSGEQELLREISYYLALYLDERTAMETRNLDIEDLLRLSQPSLEMTVARLELLHDMNEAQVFEAQNEATRWNRLAVMFAVLAAIVLLGGLLAITIGLHRYVLQPIFDLHGTIKRFRTGDVEARMETESLREVRELAQGFNEMADALAEQRARQLAFLAGVAHDLRSPLSALKIGLQAIAQEQSEARRNRSHAMLDRQVDRLARMVDDLLDATRIEAGRLEIQPEEFDLRDVVEDMIRLYAPTSPDHQIRAEMPTEPLVVFGDPLRVEQVVSNLLSNAIKFSPRGGPIGILLDCADEAVTLAVRDKGIGIRPEELKDIFLPFRRRKADIAPGAGLGLSVVRRIVEAHGGRIDVESQPDQGTVFRVTLPRKLAPAQPGPGGGERVAN
jgi:two-component system, OmpR family, sensor histidine kinase MtrB